MNEGELLREFTARAKACQLKIDCLGSGNVNSEIVIISEAVTTKEASMKMPMVGEQGRLLWDALRKHDITRKDCYVTSVSKELTTLAMKEDARVGPKKMELAHWEGLLDWELDQLPNVKYVLLLGNYALHALTGEYGIMKWRGSIFDCVIGTKRRQVKAICVSNPSHVRVNSALEPMFNFDVAKLNRVMTGQFQKHVIDEIINPTVDEAIEYIEKMRTDGAPIAIDIETIAHETACVGLANNAHSGMCINFRDASSNRYTVPEERRIREALQDLFLDDTQQFIAQKGSFDGGWLGYKDRLHIPKFWFDTLLAHHTLYPRMPHNLGYLTAQYTDHPYYKDDGKTWREGGNIDQFWRYNVKDCCITWTVAMAEWKELKQQKLENFFFDHVMRLQPHLIKMQVGGVLADMSLKAVIAEELGNELEAKLIKFHEMVLALTGDEEFKPNPKSPKQLRELFFSYLGLVGRGASTDKNNRQRMIDNPRTTPEQKELLEFLDDYLTEQKFYSTYATMRADPDSRIRCEYNQFGVQKAPGRLSSSGVLWGSGMNLQNQPHRAYPMFIADPGYMMSYFDLRQAEAKVVAHLWNVPALIENFKRAETEDGFDVHRANAARIFRCEYDEIPEGDWTEDNLPTRRYLGKRCVHGLNYRMQAPKLAEVCHIPMQQAFTAHASYHRAFPEIKEGWDDTIATVRAERMLFTPLGRRLIWLERFTEESFDSVIAFIPQSTIGDKVGQVIYQCQNDPRWPHVHARMLLNIHDALIVLHTPEVTSVVQALMKEYAESPIMIRGTPVRILTDFKQSVPDELGIHRWSTLEDIAA